MVSESERTTVSISRETWSELNQCKSQPGETFDDVIQRLAIDGEAEPPESGMCPVCDVEYSGYQHLKNGAWAWEPAEHFGIVNASGGMFCASWNAGHLYVYYHSEEVVENE